MKKQTKQSAGPSFGRSQDESSRGRGGRGGYREGRGSKYNNESFNPEYEGTRGGRGGFRGGRGGMRGGMGESVEQQE